MNTDPAFKEEPAHPDAYAAVVAARRAALLDAFRRLFPGREPREIVWEIGAGHGHFLTAYAAAHPDQCCVGIDIVSERVVRALRKRDRAKLANLEFLHAEARMFLENLPAHVRIARAFILFPDPWPKARHHKHRIFGPPFLNALALRATPECRLYFRTDHLPYFEASRETVAHSAGWTLVDEPWAFEFETVFQSRAATHRSLIAGPRRSLREASGKPAAPY